MPNTGLNPTSISAVPLAVPYASSLDIVASATIQADTRRVLYALAFPEYMEAWLQVPAADRIECHPDQRSFDRFRIDMYSNGGRHGCIYGSCFLSKPDKVTYLWEWGQPGRGTKSTVEIRLCESFKRCILKLKHSGLSSQHESDLYSTMWRSSLKRLCEIMEGLNTTGQASPPSSPACQSCIVFQAPGAACRAATGAGGLEVSPAMRKDISVT